VTSLASPRWLLASILGLLLALPAAGGGFLENSKPNDNSKAKEVQRPEYAVPAARKPVEGDAFAAWEAQLHNARLRVEEAQQNHTAADYALTRARTRRYPRGEALDQLRAQTADLLREQAAAETDFNQLLEDARRAGVPAGVLMDYMDFGDEIQRRQAARDAS
jgi:hypothetical protein